MLDRDVIEVVLDEKFDDLEMEILEDIDKKTLTETFCQYTEDDTYEWIKDNLKSFFNHGDPDWEWIRKKIQASTVERK